MYEKLQSTEERYEDLERQISDPAIIARQDEWRKMTKEHARLTELVTAYREYKQVDIDLQEAKEKIGRAHV